MKEKIIVVALLAAVLVPGQASAIAPVTGILQTNGHGMSVDTVRWMLQSSPFPVYEGTEGWEGDSGVVDTFEFQFPLDWPLSAQLTYRLHAGGHLQFLVEPVVRDSWYELPVAFAGASLQEPPQVMFVESLQVAVESPGETRLAGSLAAAPNPFRGRTRLTCHLSPLGSARLAVYDVTGQRVRSRTVAAGPDGIARLELQGMTEGVYLARLETDGFAATRKLIAR